ncbi:helix-turn-helix transcriptional regulator [Sphingorhabdus sp. 109]
MHSLQVERKLTQEHLAHAVEIDRTYLGGIERGRRNPIVAVVGRIA